MLLLDVTNVVAVTPQNKTSMSKQSIYASLMALERQL
jgi:hypothetical protein